VGWLVCLIDNGNGTQVSSLTMRAHSALWITVILFLCFSEARLRSADDLVQEARRIAGSLVHLDSPWVRYDSWPSRYPGGGRANDSQMKLTDDAMHLVKSMAAHPDAALACVKDADAKVRTLGLMALFETEDPQHLPSIASLMDDKAATFTHIGISQSPGNEYEQKADVREFAVNLLQAWMRGSGYSIWVGGEERNRNAFAKYWATHMERKHFFGLWRMKLDRASKGGNPPAKECYPKLDALRKEIEALPSPDRELVLLCLWTGPKPSGPSERSHKRWLSDEELVNCAKNLGRDKLLNILVGTVPSDDPDLQVKDASNTSVPVWPVAHFILEHANELLQREDIGRLLQIQKAGFFKSPSWAIAVSRLDPERATSVLKADFKSFITSDSDARNQEELAIELWRVAGEREMDFLIDWFYSEDSILHLDQHHLDSLFSAAKLPETRSQPWLRKIIEDPRLDGVALPALWDIADAVNELTGREVVARSERWVGPKGGKGGERFHTVEEFRLKHPEDCAQMEKAMAQWRVRLREAVAKW